MEAEGQTPSTPSPRNKKKGRENTLRGRREAAPAEADEIMDDEQEIDNDGSLVVPLPKNRGGAEYNEPDVGVDGNANQSYNYSTSSRWKYRCQLLTKLVASITEWLKEAGTDIDKLLNNIPVTPSKKELLFTGDDDGENTDGNSGFYDLLWGEDNSLASLLGDIIMKQQDYFNQQEIEQKTEFVQNLIRSNIHLIRSNIQERAERIQERAKRIQERAKLILAWHSNVKNQLAALGGRGNETALSMASNYSSVNFDSKRIKVEKVPSPARINKLVNPDLVNALRPSLVESLSEEHKLKVKNFHAHVTKILSKARTYDVNDPEFQKSIGNTVEAILSYDPEDQTENTTTEYGLPPLESCERTADQPILYAIVVMILNILEEGVDKKHGDTVTEEQAMPQVESRAAIKHGRRIDLSVQQMEEYLAALFPAMLQRAIELKVVGKNLTRFHKYQGKGKDQILGRQSRQLQYSFDFGGFGENDKVSGIVLSMASVVVYQLELKHVGTEKVELFSRQTECLPLVEPDTVPQYKFENIDGQPPAFGAYGAGDGFLLLASALMNLHSPGYSVCSRNSIGIKEYLGSGAFSHAVKLGEGMFMKIPKSAAMEKSLEGEAKILKHLADDKQMPPGIIPKLCEGKVLSELRLTFRCELSFLHCLKLNGIVGCTSSSYLRLLVGDKEKPLATIVAQVFMALQFAHKRDALHMDVRPGNIIVSPSGKNNGMLSVMLSDWGCALKMDKKQQTIFRGCPPYAHDELLGKDKGCKKKWKTDAKLDFASLVYTLGHLYEGKLLWSVFSDPTTVDEQMLKKRRDIVNERKTSWFSGLDAKTISVLTEAIKP